MDATPPVGYFKAMIYYFTCRHKQGTRALVTTSRTILVMSSGVYGYVISGPVVSMMYAAIAGLLCDGLQGSPKKKALGAWILLERRKTGDWSDLYIFPLIHNILKATALYIYFCVDSTTLVGSTQRISLSRMV